MTRERDWSLLLGGIGIGAALAYYLDADEGRRRRAYIRDQVVHAAVALNHAIPATAKDVANRARGLVAEAISRFRDEEVPDPVLVARVRSAMGRAVSHPRAIDVRAVNGCVILSGPVLASEEDDLIATVSRVPGVRGVENRLERHKTPDAVPALQGGATRAGRYGLARENWPPAIRLAAGAAGGALAAYGAERRDRLGTALGIAGIALLARAATNMPLERLTGIGAGPCAVEVQKAININAPVEEVFAFCTHWENFPRFMEHVREVRGSGQHSHWVVDGPAGVPVSWDAQVTQFIPNRVLAWKSLDGSAIQQAGIMRFDPNPDGSTRVTIRLFYNPPGGAIGHAVAKFFGADPKHQMDEDLNRLKSLIEIGRTSAPEKGEVTREELAA